MKRLEIWFQSRMKDCILNAPMQRKEMRMPFPYACPNDRWAPADVENTDAAQRQKKGRHPDLAQSFAQPILRVRFHVAEEAQRQVKLFLEQPAKSGQMGIEREQPRLAAGRQIEPNEKPFRWLLLPD